MNCGNISVSFIISVYDTIIFMKENHDELTILCGTKPHNQSSIQLEGSSEKLRIFELLLFKLRPTKFLISNYCIIPDNLNDTCLVVY